MYRPPPFVAVALLTVVARGQTHSLCSAKNSATEKNNNKEVLNYLEGKQVSKPMKSITTCTEPYPTLLYQRYDYVKKKKKKANLISV